MDQDFNELENENYVKKLPSKFFKKLSGPDVG
jgi:hypothetical protein